MTGFQGTFVISWNQTELDGLRAAPADALIVGATWQWSGEAVRVDGPGDVLVLGQSEETARLRTRAARTARRLVGVTAEPVGFTRLAAPEDPLLDGGFAVTDGRQRYTATILEIGDGRPPLLMFLNELPPVGADLWITHVAAGDLHPNRSGDAPPSVICFTPETRIATPAGPRLVRDLQEDDEILTKDDGPQPIRWIGARRISGARLVAMPELRPIRIRPGAFGSDMPEADLLVSPQHRMLMRGPCAAALYNTPEVLVEARDLVNDHSVTVDHSASEVTYVHLLLDRHQIVFANGLESESFHPGSMAFEDLGQGLGAGLLQRVPGIDRDASLYGPCARRALSRSEAAILLYKERPHH